ncbi:hypothetical protein [Amphiplicatus metriothermophilus]|uniref:DoxX-like family protein n=1 Tax=Amphiplicatus metriothermophilus TaxID=1519374 RepID=A0A239PTP1_9PROT|nr:hypothetical protein [Amphiplicatus metriothermophilus]MBB5519454.1 hypothetical protein [Amphiplicatus metriothermophilus]SNT73654.1 hypothetical protein SAMN06297382_1925 [Amphiplicatus metriothermophilus]
MMKRLLAGALAAFYGVNGASMLIDGPGWYARIPGVEHTGPYNPHFVADIGAAFLAAALGLAARAWRPGLWPAAAAGAAFVCFHALIHIAEMLGGHSRAPVADALLVIFPAALAAWSATPDIGDVHARPDRQTRA